MKNLLNLISRHPVINDIFKGLSSPQKKFQISGLWGSSRSLFIAALSRNLNLPVLVLTSGIEEAEIFFDDMSNILPSPLTAIFRDRLKLLERIVSKKWPKVLVAPIEACKEKWPPLEKISEYFLFLKQGERVDLEALLLKLADMGYRREDMVSEKGDFSQRGEIVDIFPPTFTSPLRIILRFDKISSLRSFSADTQRSEKMETKGQNFFIPPAEEDFFHRHTDAGKPHTDIGVNFSDYFKKDYLFVYDEPARELEKIPSLEEGARGTVFLTSLGEVNKIKTRSTEMFRGRLDEIIKEIKNWQKANYHIYLACNNKGEEKRLKEVLKENSVNPEIGIKTILADFKAGFILPDLKLSLLTDQEIFNRYEKKLVRRPKSGVPITGLFELNEGDYVVHLTHGIGKYLGFKHDYLSIEYRDGAKLYVPVEGLDLVQKYIGMQARPPALSRLGGKGWSKTQERTRRAIKDMAAGLLKLQAERQVFKGHAFSKDTDWQKEFEEAFIYDETPDQEKTIQETKQDMESPYSMDRLICGDVGYGKTEVAVRAAFKAVMSNKQVACLCPTTLLAYQHYNTFSERMADYPVTIACLSRFESKASQKKTIEELAAGKIDIVIGTHRLFQKDVSFKNLGLIIIDEEQRFGVAHKERIRRVSRLVDCITLSATPIPRTLYMGLAGIRDISIINTPPEERFPIETTITHFNEELIRQAILSELERDGQSFIVHNRIDTIYSFSDRIKEIVPEARIAIAHGKMSSGELEEVMIKFLKKDIDVLIATTIIASGLDIPNANTIIVDSAHTFGLADLYQLRGRVGRFKYRAYAFFIIPKFRALTGDARKRLKAIEDFTALGSGFKLALRDLEIRGAGNLLGPQQHGFVAAIGFDLYCQLLKRVVSELKGEKIEEPKRVTFEVGMDLSFPLDYVPGKGQRLDIYRRMAMLKDRDEIKAFEEELSDRFGTLPERAGKVMEALKLKDMARQLGIVYLGRRGKKLLLRFSSDCSLELQNLNRIEEDLRNRLSFGQDSTIFIKLKSLDKDIIPVIRGIFKSIESSHLVV